MSSLAWLEHIAPPSDLPDGSKHVSGTLPVEESCDQKDRYASEVPPEHHFEVEAPVDMTHALNDANCHYGGDLQQHQM